MESYAYALALYPLTPVKSVKPTNRNTKSKVGLVSCLGNLSLCYDSRFNRKSPVSLFVSNQRWNGFKVRAASVPENTGETQKKKDLVGTLKLGSMFAIWYLLNIYFNIYNKQVLKVYPFPATVTAFQFGCGTVLILLMWGLNLYPRPKVTRSQFAAILPLAVIHTMGNMLTNISLGKVAVSFTHTIKAMEPFFTVVLSALFIGECKITSGSSDWKLRNRNRYRHFSNPGALLFLRDDKLANPSGPSILRINSSAYRCVLIELEAEIMVGRAYCPSRDGRAPEFVFFHASMRSATNVV